MNGVDVDRFSPGEGDVRGMEQMDVLRSADEGEDAAGRRAWGRREDREREAPVVRVGLVATYARWKGHEVFLRAVGELMRSPPRVPVRFYVVGGPIYTTLGSQYSREELLSLARELGVAGHVALVPFQPDPLPVYRALDVVVHASTQSEPFGLSVAEAMACGKAVIVSAAGGVAELIEPGVDAIAVTPGDVSAMTQAMRELIQDPRRRAELGSAARKSAVANLDRRRIGPALLAIYRTLSQVTADRPLARRV